MQPRMASKMMREESDHDLDRHLDPDLDRAIVDTEEIEIDLAIVIAIRAEVDQLPKTTSADDDLIHMSNKILLTKK
jgi:hypothetical protein